MDSWKQYHGNGSNQGFLPVQTSLTTKPKWILEIGKVACVSPVIGADGTIYVGTLNGELVAVNPDGTVKWKHQVTMLGHPDYPGIITSTPALANDGNIYVITTVDGVIENKRGDGLKSIHIRRSSLHSFTPTGNRRWSYRFPSAKTSDGLGAYTLSSPKVCGNENIFIFVPALNVSKSSMMELLIINQSGNLVSKTEVSTVTLSNIVEDTSIWNYLKNSEEFNQLIKENNETKITDWPEPTIGIFNSPLHNGQTIILVENNVNTLTAFRWHFPVLAPIWTAASEKNRQHTSPAVLSNGKIYAGGKDGAIICYNLENGNEITKIWPEVNQPILSPPVCIDNRIYFISGNQIVLIDSDFQIKAQFTFTGKSVGPLSLSANHVYLNASDGFYVFSLDLNLLEKNPGFIGGTSISAISQDGRVYALDQQGKLWMFGK